MKDIMYNNLLVVSIKERKICLLYRGILLTVLRLVCGCSLYSFLLTALAKARGFYETTDLNGTNEDTSLDGFNFVSNPYPFRIDWNATPGGVYTYGLPIQIELAQNSRICSIGLLTSTIRL